MDPKKKQGLQQDDDLRGFQDFIDSQSDQTATLKSPKKDISHEQVTFLTNDSLRLTKIKNLLTSKLPFVTQHEQGLEIIKKANEEGEMKRSKLFEIFSKPSSNYHKSISAIFDSYYNNKKN
jgi:hypothetical protein